MLFGQSDGHGHVTVYLKFISKAYSPPYGCFVNPSTRDVGVAVDTEMGFLKKQCVDIFGLSSHDVITALRAVLMSVIATTAWQRGCWAKTRLMREG